jgi:RNA polymerase sigma-70 factor (ECF subfamily)
MQGEVERFEEIYAEHWAAVRAYVRRRAPEHLVDDVVSETFLVCLRRLDVVPSNVRPWLFAVARKTLANERRRLARQPLAPAVVTIEPEPVGDTKLAAAFACLGDRDRELLRLVAWEGVSLRDAAIVLGCSPVACRVRYHRAKLRLKARLDAAAAFRPRTEGAVR